MFELYGPYEYSPEIREARFIPFTCNPQWEETRVVWLRKPLLACVMLVVLRNIPNNYLL